jgi:hypothetical protein
MNRSLDRLGRLIARYLQKSVAGCEPFTRSDPDALRQSLQPGDVLLVEGNNHIAGVIKYLTPIDMVAFGALCRSAAGAAPALPAAREDAAVGAGVIAA